MGLWVENDRPEAQKPGLKARRASHHMVRKKGWELRGGGQYEDRCRGRNADTASKRLKPRSGIVGRWATGSSPTRGAKINPANFVAGSSLRAATRRFSNEQTRSNRCFARCIVVSLPARRLLAPATHHPPALVQAQRAEGNLVTLSFFVRSPRQPRPTSRSSRAREPRTRGTRRSRARPSGCR